MVNAPLQAATGGGGLQLIIMMVLMFAVFYFLLIRPQQKRQKEHRNLLNSLKKGDKVVTIGGLHGVITEVTDDTIVLRVNDVTKLTFNRSSISSVVPRETEETA
ncbi:preprotein translocase subunit YajC [Neobacillus mesonae]|nr:preprotein translocase subunit YajC [Neobacillus mesonae]